MLQYPLRTVEDAPTDSVETIQNVDAAYGFVPNLVAILGNAPAAVDGYAAVSSAFASSSLSPIEQQVVLLTTSVENECTYCVAAHSAVATKVGAADDIVTALRGGAPLADARLEALRALTLSIVRDRGRVSDPVVQRFLEAGFTAEQVLEVVTGVAQKTMSNYTNHLAQTPLDEVFQPFAWSPARERGTVGVS